MAGSVISSTHGAAQSTVQTDKTDQKNSTAGQSSKDSIVGQSPAPNVKTEPLHQKADTPTQPQAASGTPQQERDAAVQPPVVKSEQGGNRAQAPSDPPQKEGGGTRQQVANLFNSVLPSQAHGFVAALTGTDKNDAKSSQSDIKDDTSVHSACCPIVIT